MLGTTQVKGPSEVSPRRHTETPMAKGTTQFAGTTAKALKHDHDEIEVELDLSRVSEDREETRKQI